MPGEPVPKGVIGRRLKCLWALLQKDVSGRKVKIVNDKVGFPPGLATDHHTRGKIFDAVVLILFCCFMVKIYILFVPIATKASIVCSKLLLPIKIFTIHLFLQCDS